MQNVSEVELIALNSSHSNQILSLIRLVQPSLPWTIEYLEWQFYENPAGPARIYGFRNLEGDLVALYAAVPQHVKDEDGVVIARMVQDVMTHPDYRGRGLLHRLAERCLLDMREAGEVGYTFPNEKSANSFQRTGWTQLCIVPARQIKLSSSKTTERPSGIDLTPVAGLFEESIVSVWQASGLGCGVARTAAFLNWRYKKPDTEYFKFYVNTTEGFLVLKVYSTPTYEVLHICDLLVREDRRELIPKILQFCVNFASTKKASILTAWLHEKHPYAIYFDQIDLKLDVNPNRRVFVFDGKPRNAGLTDAQLWHLTQGDSDVY